MLESLNAYKFIIVAINLLVLYLFLKKFLFKPVTAFMEKRTATIKESLTNAETVKLEAHELKQKYEDQLRSAKVEVEKIMNDAVIRANKEHDAIVDAAELKAAGIIENANKEIERNKLSVLKDIKNQVSSLALAAASKVIEVNMDTAANRAIVDKFINEEGAA